MKKHKKVRKPFREDNFHHLLFGDSECSNPDICECSIEDIDRAICDWETVISIELQELKSGLSESAARNLKQARKEVMILKLQKREMLARAI